MEELERLLTSLDERRGKHKVEDICGFCERNQSFSELLLLFPSASPRRRGTLAWVMARSVSNRMWAPWEEELETLVMWLRSETEDTMTKRSLLDIFQYTELPDEQLGTLADICIGFIRSPKETAAVRAFSITVLMRIIKVYPEIYREVEEILIELAAHDKPSIGLRARKAIKEMEKISSEL